MNVIYIVNFWALWFLVIHNDICVSDRIISDPIIRKGSSLKDFCNKSVEIYEDITSPKLTIVNYGKPLTCWYKFRSFRGNALQEWILRVRFKKFKFGTLLNSTDCEGGYMQIIDGNAKTNLSNRKDQGIFCGEIEQMQTFISETSFVKVLFHTDNFTDQTYYSFDTRAEQEYNLYHRFGKHPELYPNRRGHVVPGTYCERIFKDCRLQTCYVQSPAYPGIYPRGMHCTYHLNTKLPFIKLYIENEDFNVDGQRCENIISCPMRQVSAGIHSCPNDYIRIYDGKNASAREIGTFCGMGKFPYSIIGTSQDLFVEFVTSRAGPLLNTGFHFNVGSWPGHMETAGIRNGSCSWIMTNTDLKTSASSEGIFLSVVHWYPPYTSCTYLIQGPRDHIVRIYFPSLRINKIQSPIASFSGDCGESLTIYDSPFPDDSKIVKTFCDTFSKAIEKFDFISTGPALFVRFESKTGSYSGSSLYYWAHYDFFNNTKFGVPVAGTSCDEEFYSWKGQRGWFRSPMNTLIYKKKHTQLEDTIQCRYKFFTNHRMYARIILSIESVAFKMHPFGLLCKTCWDDKVDKLLIWEEDVPFVFNKTTMVRNNRRKRDNLAAVIPKSSTTNNKVDSMMMMMKFGKMSSPRSICLCANTTTSSPVSVISLTENLNLELVIDSSHTSGSYFKYDSALFEATYKFVHEPICGTTIFEDANEGELHFPNYQMLGFIESARNVHCIWDIRVRSNRDVSLHFDQVKFASKNCHDGKLEVHLPSIPGRPFMSVCGHNITTLHTKIITSIDLIPVIRTDPYRYIQLQFIGMTIPTKTILKIGWTELFHVPRNTTGSMMKMERLTKTPDCQFVCPGELFCIPTELECNGETNCSDYNKTFEAVGEVVDICVKTSNSAWTTLFTFNSICIACGVISLCILACRYVYLFCVIDETKKKPYR